MAGSRTIASALDAWEKAAQADPTGPAGRRPAGTPWASYDGHGPGGGRLRATWRRRATYWQKITQIDPGSDEAFQAEQNISRTDPSRRAPAETRH